MMKRVLHGGEWARGVRMDGRQRAAHLLPTALGCSAARSPLLQREMQDNAHHMVRIRR